MITEDYVSFEIAKLLKEKGFLEGMDLRITQNLSFYDNIGLHHNLNKWYDSLIRDKIDFVVAPTHQMAMKWLREKGIHMSIDTVISSSGNIYFNIDTNSEDSGWNHPVDFYNSYEEAIEAALKYCLENLI